MVKKVLDISEKPTIKLEVKGNLTLKGWEQQQVQVMTDNEESLMLERDGDEVSCQCQENCSIYVPVGSTIICDRIYGNATIKSLHGDLKASEVSGNLLLREVNSVSIGQLDGNLTAKNISGDLSVDSAHGNVSARDVQGDFVITDKAHGNISLEDVDGNARAKADGNITLRLDPAIGNSYQFETGSNLVCRIPPDSSAEIEIPAAERITINIPGITRPDDIQAPYNLTIGEGEAKLILSAGGNLLLGASSLDWGFEDFDVDIGEDIESMTEVINEQVTQQIEAQLEMLEQQLETQMDNLSTMISTSGLSPEKAERIVEKARSASERASTRAQAKLQRAHEKLQRKLEAARRRAERQARTAERAARDRRRRPSTFEWSPPQPETPGEPVSDEERLMILEMLEQGKISTEEAEQLLSALESKGP
jgi:hypothetical protein